MSKKKYNKSENQPAPSVNLAGARSQAQEIYRRYTGKPLSPNQMETFAKDFREGFINWLHMPLPRHEREEGYFYVKCGGDHVLRVRGAWVLEAHRKELGDPYRMFVFIQPLATFLKHNPERVFDYPFYKKLSVNVIRI